MNNLTFRLHTLADEPAIAIMMHGMYDEGDGIRDIDDDKIARTFAYLRAGGRNGSCLVAVDQTASSIVGYALLFPFWSSEYGGLLLLLDELYVTPERRSQGIGGQFLEYIEQYARDLGYVALNFLTMNHNTRAIDFYLRHGYYLIPAVTFDKLLG
jgi:GNAT superfamily N-acetyltransferase